LKSCQSGNAGLLDLRIAADTLNGHQDSTIPPTLTSSVVRSARCRGS